MYLADVMDMSQTPRSALPFPTLGLKKNQIDRMEDQDRVREIQRDRQNEREREDKVEVS